MSPLRRIVNPLVWLLVIGTFATSLPALDTAAWAQVFFRRHHNWGRFRPGAWQLARVETSTLDADGQVVSSTTTEKRTTLESVNDDAVRLRVEAAVHVAGKRIVAQPQQLEEGWFGSPAGGNFTVTDLGGETLTIQQQSYPCRVEQVEAAADGVQTIITSWYNDRVAPYLLRRESSSIDLATGQTLSQTTVEVVQLSARRRFLFRLRPVAELRIEHRHPKGTSATTAWISSDVPGGTIDQVIEEYDPSGRLLRRSKFDLVDFSVR